MVSRRTYTLSFYGGHSITLPTMNRSERRCSYFIREVLAFCAHLVCRGVFFIIHRIAPSGFWLEKVFSGVRVGGEGVVSRGTLLNILGS